MLIYKHVPMFRFTLVVLIWCLGGVAVAQTPQEEYYPYAGEEVAEKIPLSDTTLFYRAVQEGSDLYGAITDFNLPYVADARRGVAFYAERAIVEGLQVDYSAFGLMRLLGADEEYDPTRGIRRFAFGDRLPLRPFRVATSVTDRNYRVRVRLVADGELGRGWTGAVAIDGRTGRDALMDGVFTHALDAGFRLKRSTDGAGEVVLTVLMPLSLRAGRATATEEAFMLTGDRYYNPAWGWQCGKMRSARVRRDAVPVAWLTCKRKLSERTCLCAWAGAEGGLRSRSGLGWYDARSPLPDNYRYMPSFTGDVATDAAWRNADPTVVQIDWDELIRRNRMAEGGRAIYAVEDRVERLLRLNAGVRFHTTIDPRTDVWYEAGWAQMTSRNFKRMHDLLGADHIIDIDQYLIDDDTYDNKLQNNLRHPDRKIRRGDRFGYDYRLEESVLRLAGGVEYHADRFRLEAGAEVERREVHRRGYYEKELFPEAGSFGCSRRMKFTPCALHIGCGYSFSPRSYLGVRVATEAAMPHREDLFVQPLYNNRVADGVGLWKKHSAEVLWRLSGRVVDVEATAFIGMVADESERMNYFDDTAGEYCDLVATGIDRMALGVEAASKIRLGYRWTLSLAACVARYTYLCDPRVTVLSDADNHMVDDGAVSHLDGVAVGNMPRLSGVAEVEWRGAKGWNVCCSAGYSGERSIGISMLRRTDRVARQVAATPEAEAQFLDQQSLGDAFTLNLSVLKCFYFERSMLAVNLSVRNLTDHRSFYGGYESSRVMKYRSGAELFVRPQASRFSYAPPRTCLLSVSYRF